MGNSRLNSMQFRELMSQEKAFVDMCKFLISNFVANRYISERQEKFTKLFLFENQSLKQIGIDENLSKTTVAVDVNRTINLIRVYSSINNLGRLYVFKSDFDVVNTEYAIFKRAHVVSLKLLSILENPNMDILVLPIDQCGFSTGLKNSLRAFEIEAICDIFTYLKIDFQSLRHFGKTKMKELEDFLQQYELRLLE